MPYKISGNDPCEFEPGWPLLHTASSTVDYSYNLNGLPNGNYVLQAYDFHYAAGETGYFLSEFHTSSGEATDCGNAEILSITDPSDWLFDKDFSLHEGGVISGTVYQQSGATPVTTNMVVTVYSAATEQIVDEIGPAWYYSSLLEPGDYYLYITETAGDAPFAWWATPDTVKDFSAAHQITVTAGQMESGKDFRLDSLQSTPSLAPIYMLLLNKQPPVTGL